MRVIVLIAANFVREQRWLAVLLAVYALGGAMVFGYATDDIVFFFDQQAVYAVLFSLFLAASAIHNERRSRRIVAVLSKALTRRQYLAGLLLGVSTVFLIYCLAIGVAGTWLMRHSGWRPSGLWLLLGYTALAALLTATLTLFYSTFLRPLFATAAAAMTLGLPAALERALGARWGKIIPVYSLAVGVSRGAASTHHQLRGDVLLVATIEIIALWAAATWIFERRDITLALE